MNGAQLLVEQLIAEGVDTIFALPGVQIMGIFDALYDVQDRIRVVQTRHEQATTYMAYGYAKATGRAGVALVVPGPGALNAAAGLGTAYAGSAPVLLISGQISSDALGQGQGQLHEVDDQLDVFRPLTKWNHRVKSTEEISEAVHEGMRQIKTGRPRPVELEFPSDLLAGECQGSTFESIEYPAKTGHEADVEAAAKLLGGASNPVIIAGGGTVIAGASKELLELATLIEAPVMTTQQGKGIVPEEHPLSVGVNYAMVGPAQAVIPECDVILAVGTRFLFRNLRLREDQKVIQIDVDSQVLGRNYPTEIAIEADARETLAQLIEHLRDHASSHSGRGEAIESYRRTFREQLHELAPEQVKIIETLREALADDAIVVSGITNIGSWSHFAYSVRQPRTYITSSYFGTLGYAFPTALGAQAAFPDRQVVAICGDGGFLYAAQELATALKYGLNVVILVFNNDSYGASEWHQTHDFQGRYIGTDLYNPDFVQLAESFGAIGLRTTPEALDVALREALAAEKPVVLEMALPNRMPPFHLIDLDSPAQEGI
ncbi:MAG: thiamine pyrophosphate-dependent enzyme [Acidobacteriota bacterium]